MLIDYKQLICRHIDPSLSYSENVDLYRLKFVNLHYKSIRAYLELTRHAASGLIEMMQAY